MIWLQENWIIAAVIAVLIVLIIGFLIRRPKADRFDFGDEEEVSAQPSKAHTPKPLEPKKPEIVAAEPARFKPLEPAAPPAPKAAPASAAVPTPAAPIAPVPETAAETAAAPIPSAPQAAPAAPAPASGNNLRLIKGLGPKLATLLNSLGIHSFEQIAAWTDADIARIDPQLGAFQGRIARDNWVDQAGYLARRDKVGFEAKYGALGGEL